MRHARATARPGRRRVDLVALVVAAACLVATGWAVRGLLQDRVPEPADFGTAATVVLPDPATVTVPPGTAGDPSATRPASRPAATDPAGGLPRPGRLSASPPPVEQRTRPVRLTVPSVDLDVRVDPVGLAEDGQMEIPDAGDRAGWYRYGPAPGSEEGSVVIASHVDTRSGPGAFLALGRVQEGAAVEVELEDGTRLTYRVVAGAQVAKRELAVDEVFRRDGSPVLRLVTCSGRWDPRLGHYTDNLVLTAEPAG